MATETGSSTPDVAKLLGGDWRLGLAAGLVAGLAFGGVVSVTSPDVLRSTIPAVYGVAPPDDPVFGWIVHVLHASVLGIGFSAVIGLSGLSGASAREQVGAAIVYALAVWLAFAVVALPVWLSLVESGVSVPFPYVSSAMLAGHAAYGVVLGIVYYAFDVPADEDDRDRSATGGN